ncbi:MOSC domain-containing protein [Ktedonosporobacter rubrisoli]|uniref:MOSC domain-containing protein n=1 Tax=Ktedonosporobacter rubrisoli TaxID=2509675 RepID=A0A4P6K230_KTERU|nr:MOSC domain-containing protein [Ktedonosporobacter rubrisoli]QBD82257.1 MOSC domain-containing protein [Ktedonosporobacter rubrisoli]
MWKGTVISLHITPAEGQPMRTITEAHTVPGRGIEGDRYYLGTGHFSPHHGPSHELTLIELETIQALNREYPELAHFTPGEARRNIVTRDVPLNHLVQHEFRVGEVVLRGIRLCEPCFHIAQLTHHNVLTGLIHRGGLRAQILTAGIIRPGDEIERLYPYSSFFDDSELVRDQVEVPAQLQASKKD